MNPITPREAAIIGVRIVVIYFILQLLQSLVVAMATIFLPPSLSDMPRRWDIIIGWGMGLIFSILCWIAAPKIASIIIRSDATQSTESAFNLQTCLFRAIGVGILITTLPEFIGVILVFIHNNSVSMSMGLIDRSWVMVVRLLLSLGLIVSAPVLTHLLKKLRFGSAT